MHDLWNYHLMYNTFQDVEPVQQVLNTLALSPRPSVVEPVKLGPPIPHTHMTEMTLHSSLMPLWMRPATSAETLMVEQPPGVIQWMPVFAGNIAMCLSVQVKL